MGSVTIDGDVVIISKRMRGETRIDLAQVSGISIERAGLGMKAIRFMTAGGTAGHRSPVLGSSRDLANDPQALTFRSKHLAEFQAFAAEAEARRAELS
jgi:hypothetical protein